MLKYPLYDFIATVPSCVETTTLAIVLEIFEQEQCDRLMVLNQQQCPIGLLYSARLGSQLLAAAVKDDQYFNYLDLQQPVATLGLALIQPIQTLPASDGVEQFGAFLGDQQTQTNTNLDWALIDKDGKFLGFVDSRRLLQFVARQKLEISSQNNSAPAFRKAPHRSSTGTTVGKNQADERQDRVCQPMVDKALVQLLERLPWPLMLQTSTGEVVTQNPAWWQQLGALKDPEGVRQQVQAMLSTATNSPPVYYNGSGALANSEEQSKHSQHKPQLGLPHRSKSDWAKNHQQIPEAAGASRCFLDSQLGTCTCVVEVQNGQERVWQFVKIPLHSPDLEILSPHSELPLSTDLWLMLATDVTEQQQLCKELAAKNADLIQLNRLKDEFLACISHELKTPLTAVLGLSRLLVDQQLGELNERQARYAGLIHQSGRHLMSVVNDILDLTRMETGQMELTLCDVKIRAVCDRAISEAKTIHRESSKATHLRKTQASPLRDHQFTISIEPGLEELVADELRLRQMLVHLLSNAFKFTETGGEIGLWVNRWQGWITFTVWDTGIGIPEHQQHLIFQKFQQLENPLTRQHEGTGLGLVLTRALARLHGGDVSFISREGKGSQFTLLLPPSPPHKRAGDMGSQHRVQSSLSGAHPAGDARSEERVRANATLTLPKSPSGLDSPVPYAGRPPSSTAVSLKQEKSQSAKPPLPISGRHSDVLLSGSPPAFPGSPTAPVRPIEATGIRWGQQDLETKGGGGAGFPDDGEPTGRHDATCLHVIQPPGSVPPPLRTGVENPNGQMHASRFPNLISGLPSIEESVVPKQDQEKENSPDLPRSKSCDPESNSAPVSTGHTHHNSLVLVVEAVARYIEDLTEQLTYLGYRVVIARSGCEALEKARRLQPKAIFLNPLLPLLSGWDVLTLLKSDAATRHIPVVVTATRAEKQQAIANRAEGFLSLPVQHQVLTPLLENLCATPEQQQKLDGSETISTKTPLRILRLVDPEWESIHSLSLQNHRIVEVDDLDQAELLARFWHFDVVLLDAEMPVAGTYLQKLSDYPRLAALPLVTCDVATTSAASQIANLSVFPCLLTPFGNDQRIGNRKTDALLSVLQIAAGVCCPPSIFVVDFAMLPDLPEVRHLQVRGYRSENNSSPRSDTAEMNTPSPFLGLKPLTISRGSEWFQALIQYLQTAGLKAVMGRSWAELLQQIRHQSVDLLLICLGESTVQKEVYSALKVLGQLPFNLPPVLVLDRRLNPAEIEPPHISQKQTQDKNNAVESIETVASAIAKEILPRSISMEDLLNQIHQALNVGCFSNNH